MTVRISAPFTKTQALTTAYLAEDFVIHGAERIELWLDSRVIGFTVRQEIQGGDQLEKAFDADGHMVIEQNAGVVVSLNVKAASGTPTAQIEVK